jgi:hypothetical protein
MSTMQPLTASGRSYSIEADTPITITRKQIEAAMQRWEAEFRAGKCIPSHEVETMPVGEVARLNTAAFLHHLANAAAVTGPADDEL